MSHRLSADDFSKLIASKKAGFEIRAHSNMYDASCLRFSSGIYSLDRALGRGFPFGRIVLISGPESSGKSTIAYKAMGAVQHYDEATKKHQLDTPAESFIPGKTLLIDAEASYSPEWASVHLNPEHVYIAPTSFAEEVGDLITQAIHYNSFSLIVIDSIASLITKTEQQRSLEDHSVGEVARILSRSFVKWTNELASVIRSGGSPPCILMINQLRTNIGVMYGPKETIPGGKAQKYYSAIHVSMRSAKKDSEDKSDANTPHKTITISGVCDKNKTATPKRPFEFDMDVADSEDHSLGKVDNVKPMFKDGLTFGIIEKTGEGVVFNGEIFPTQKALKEALYESSALQERLRAALLEVV